MAKLVNNCFDVYLHIRIFIQPNASSETEIHIFDNTHLGYDGNITHIAKI
jgi:hypothetical protein